MLVQLQFGMLPGARRPGQLKRIKSFRIAKPRRKLRWTERGPVPSPPYRFYEIGLYASASETPMRTGSCHPVTVAIRSLKQSNLRATASVLGR